MVHEIVLLFFFFFNDTATTEIYTLSLHDALPISVRVCIITTLFTLVSACAAVRPIKYYRIDIPAPAPAVAARRSEEHTSELQSQSNLVCRLLLEKKKTN